MKKVVTENMGLGNRKTMMELVAINIVASLASKWQLQHQLLMPKKNPESNGIKLDLWLAKTRHLKWCLC